MPSLCARWKLLYIFFPPAYCLMEMNTLCRHTTQILSRILNIIRILSRFIIISRSRQRIHNIDVDVEITISIAAATPLKDETFIVRSLIAHYCVVVGSGPKWKVIAIRIYSIHGYRVRGYYCKAHTVHILHGDINTLKCICLAGISRYTSIIK